MKLNYTLPLIGLAVAACAPAPIELPEPSTGELDVTRPLVLMDQMGSGFRDFEQFRSAQESSVAQLIANQLEASGAGRLANGLMVDELGFGNRRKLGYTIDCNGDTFLFAIPFEGMPSQFNTDNYTKGMPYNVQAVPEFKISDLDNANFDETNPYYERISTHETPIEALRELNPTSFAVWMGMDDIYQYAKTGASDESLFTSVTEFEANLDSLLRNVSRAGGNGVIATIPDMIDAPFFNLIPWNALDIDADQAMQLNLVYLLNQDITFEEGPNGFVYQEGLMNFQMNENDKIVVTVDLDEVKCNMYGSLTPFPDQEVLSETEIRSINERRRAFNEIIRVKAERFGLALVDMDALLNPIKDGSQFFDGIEVSGVFASGGFYSIDGYNPTGRGSAIITNAFISALNERYNANIPAVSVSEYEGATLPSQVGLQ